MNKLIIALIVASTGFPALAQTYSPAANSLIRTTEAQQSYQPYRNPVTGGYPTYTPCYSPDINPPITRTEYPGALDPQRRLPAWVYNP